MSQLLDSIKAEEGSKVVGGRHVVYPDSLGLETCGYGRLLSRGFSQDEAELMLANDLAVARAAASQYSWFAGLSQNRQDAVVDMIFNIGPTRFAGFVDLIAALTSGSYSTAAAEMLDSRWHVQVGKRAERLARIMASGVWE